MSDFQALLEEMAGEEERLQKALEGNADDDAEIEDAAEPDGDEDADDDDDEYADDDEPMGKSLNVTLENGAQVRAIDGTEMVKSLIAKQEEAATNVESLAEKTVSLLKSMAGTLERQNDKIATLEKSLHDLGSKGRGRRSKVVIHDRQGADVTEAAAADPAQDVMAKALSAFDDKKITGVELNTIDYSLRHHQTPPADLLAKIV